MRRSFLPILALALWPVSSHFVSAPDAADATQFQLSGKKQVRINDALVQDARIYMEAGGGRMLIVAPALRQAWLIDGGRRLATEVDPKLLHTAGPENDRIVLRGRADAGRTWPVEVDGLRLKTTIAQWRLLVEQRTPLVGEVGVEELFSYAPEYRQNAAKYQPASPAMQRLRERKTATQVEVFLGTWCIRSEEVVPRLIRVAQELANPALVWRYHALPAGLVDDPLARRWNVDRPPAAVVLQGDRLIGRLDFAALQAPEETLVKLLGGEHGARQ